MNQEDSYFEDVNTSVTDADASMYSISAGEDGGAEIENEMELANKVFIKLDRDHKGYLTRYDIAMILSDENQQQEPELLDEILKTLDPDGQGKVTRDYFLQGFSQFIGNNPYSFQQQSSRQQHPQGSPLMTTSGNMASSTGYISGPEYEGASSSSNAYGYNFDPFLPPSTPASRRTSVVSTLSGAAHAVNRAITLTDDEVHQLVGWCDKGDKNFVTIAEINTGFCYYIGRVLSQHEESQLQKYMRDSGNEKGIPLPLFAALINEFQQSASASSSSNLQTTDGNIEDLSVTINEVFSLDAHDGERQMEQRQKISQLERKVKVLEATLEYKKERETRLATDGQRLEDQISSMKDELNRIGESLYQAQLESKDKDETLDEYTKVIQEMRTQQSLLSEDNTRIVYDYHTVLSTLDEEKNSNQLLGEKVQSLQSEIDEMRAGNATRSRRDFRARLGEMKEIHAMVTKKSQLAKEVQNTAKLSEVLTENDELREDNERNKSIIAGLQQTCEDLNSLLRNRSFGNELLMSSPAPIDVSQGSFNVNKSQDGVVATADHSLQEQLLTASFPDSESEIEEDTTVIVEDENLQNEKDEQLKKEEEEKYPINAIVGNVVASSPVASVVVGDNVIATPVTAVVSDNVIPPDIGLLVSATRKKRRRHLKKPQVITHMPHSRLQVETYKAAKRVFRALKSCPTSFSDDEEEISTICEDTEQNQFLQHVFDNLKPSLSSMCSRSKLVQLSRNSSAPQSIATSVRQRRFAQAAFLQRQQIQQQQQQRIAGVLPNAHESLAMRGFFEQAVSRSHHEEQGGGGEQSLFSIEQKNAAVVEGTSLLQRHDEKEEVGKTEVKWVKKELSAVRGELAQAQSLCSSSQNELEEANNRNADLLQQVSRAQGELASLRRRLAASAALAAATEQSAEDDDEEEEDDDDDTDEGLYIDVEQPLLGKKGRERRRKKREQSCLRRFFCCCCS